MDNRELTRSRRFRFDFARPEDDADLRRIFTETSMPGAIRLRFEREPSFFRSQLIHGPEHQVLVLRDHDRAVGVGTRSVGRMNVSIHDGRRTVERIGYLSNLRLLKEYRGRGVLLARAYEFLHEQHLRTPGEERPRRYLTTIAEDNETAIRLLTNDRAGLPTYEFAGRYHTYAIPRTPRAFRSNRQLEVRPMERDELPQLLEFIDREGRRQFLPKYEPSHFFGDESIFLGMRPPNIQLAIAPSGGWLGTLGLWDQRCFRQVVVERYSPTLKTLRPLINVAAWIGRSPGLPATGAVLPQIMAALPIVACDDTSVFETLIAACVERLADMNADYLMLGLHEADPLAAVVERRCARRYTTRLYYVYWPEDEAATWELDDGVPYLELGCL